MVNLIINLVIFILEALVVWLFFLSLSGIAALNFVIFILGIFIMWLLFISLMSIAVLNRIIKRSSYIFLGIIMYFFMCLYYTIWENFHKVSNEELLDTLIKIQQFIDYELTSEIFNNSFKKKLFKTIEYLASDQVFLILTLIIIYTHIDYYYHAENKLALILLNQVKGRNYSWWEPDSWWELYL